jgi:uncharacterized membrane protein YdjX (TVP38/TMEM64 family)
MHPATRRQLAGVAGLVAIAVGVGLFFSPAAVLTDLQHLATHPVLFLLAVMAIYLVRPFLFWPISAVELVLGFVYGPAVAIPVSLAGVCLTCLPPYVLARSARTEAGLFGAIADSGRSVVGNVGEFRGILAGRLSPVPGDAVSYGAGLARVSLVPFLGATIVGEIPWAITFVLAGDSMRTLTIEGAQPDLTVLVALTGLGLLVLSGPLYRRYGQDLGWDLV